MNTLINLAKPPLIFRSIGLFDGNHTATIFYSGRNWFLGNFARLPVSNLHLNIQRLLATSKLRYSEEELVLALKRNERAAFDFLYDHYSGALYNIISKTLRDEEKAADVLQESFLKIWKNIASYNPEKGRLFTWIMNIARNGAIDAVRVEGRKPVMDDIDDRVALNERDTDEDSQMMSSEMKAIVEMLRPERKVLIDMAYFQGYTHEEISEKLGVPLGTVKSRIRTALQELKKYFSA